MSLVSYEYDKYDIIDFLETQYINDWLNLIPDNEWIKNKKAIEYKVSKLTEPEIISLVISKINLNLPKYIVVNFEQINVDLLKFCVETNFDKLKKEIKKNPSIYKQIIDKCIYNMNYEFNKYFYENIYFELEPTHKIQQNSANILNLYGLLQKNVHKNNMFYDQLINNLQRNWGSDALNFKVLKYYNSIFLNIFKIKKENENVKSLFVKIFKINFEKGEINNFEDLNELKNIFGISDKQFKIYIVHILYDKSILDYVCASGDIDFIIELINKLDDDILKENITNVMVHTALLNKIENVFLMYNLLVYEKKCVFTKEMYSEIIIRLVFMRKSKYDVYKYNKIIYEFINLGGKIRGYSTYTDYIDRLKIKN